MGDTNTRRAGRALIHDDHLEGVFDPSRESDVAGDQRAVEFGGERHVARVVGAALVTQGQGCYCQWLKRIGPQPEIAEVVKGGPASSVSDVTMKYEAS